MANTVKKSVQLFYDIASPYSWIALETLSRYQTRWAINLRLRPTFLGGIMNDADNKPPGLHPRKATYLNRDTQRLAEMYKIPIKQPANPFELMLEKGTLRAQRFLTAIELTHPNYLEETSRQLYLRAWNRDEPVYEPPDFAEAAKAAGMSQNNIKETLDKYQDGKEVKARLKETTDEVCALGAFGAPVILVEGKDEQTHFIFGSDRMEVIAMLLGEKYQGPLPELSKL